MKPAFQKAPVGKKFQNLGRKSKTLKSYWCPLSPLHFGHILNEVQSREVFNMRKRCVETKRQLRFSTPFSAWNQPAAAPRWGCAAFCMNRFWWCDPEPHPWDSEHPSTRILPVLDQRGEKLDTKLGLLPKTQPSPGEIPSPMRSKIMARQDYLCSEWRFFPTDH